MRDNRMEHQGMHRHTREYRYRLQVLEIASGGCAAQDTKPRSEVELGVQESPGIAGMSPSSSTFGSIPQSYSLSQLRQAQYDQGPPRNVDTR